MAKFAKIPMSALLTASIISLALLAGTPKSFAALPPGASQYSYSYDCTKMVYIVNEELYIADADGSNAVKLTDVDDSISAGFPRLSPDSSKIAFLNNHGFYIINSDGTGLLPLADFFTGGTWPSWSPDSSKIAFMWSLQLYTVNADGTELTNLTPDLPSQPVDGDGDADWSPDGTKIVFDRVIFTGEVTEDNEAIAIHDLALINPDGTSLTSLLDHGGLPRWAHDGTKIYFTGSQQQGSAIYSVNPDGTDETLVTQIDESFHMETVLCGQIEDSTPPSVTITSPADGAALSSDTFTVLGTASDFGTGLDKVEVSLDGGSTWQSASGTESWTFGVTGPLPGLVTIMARATDNADNVATVSIQVTTPITVTIETKSLGGETLRMWTSIDPPDTSPQSGFAPNTVTAPAGDYVVMAQDYGVITFDHWEDGSTARTRIITLTDDTTLTALYNTNSLLRGFTTLTYTGTEAQPDLTVQALSLGDGHPLRMWTYISAGPTTPEGTEYSVTVHNYRDRVFDHWEDGSNERVRNLTIGEATTITAYYATTIEAPNRVQFVYEDCGLSSAGCGVGTITCSDGTTTGPGPISLAFGLTVRKSSGNPVQGSWSAVIPGAAGPSGASGTLNTLSFDGTNFKAEGDLSGAICEGDPLDNVKVIFSGQCGGTEVRFEATNGVKATIQGDVTCTTV